MLFGIRAAMAGPLAKATRMTVGASGSAQGPYYRTRRPAVMDTNAVTTGHALLDVQLLCRDSAVCRSNLQASLTAERARVDSLSADAEAAAARAAGAESRLAALEADGAEWRARYSKEAAARVEMQGQRDQVGERGERGINLQAHARTSTGM